MIFIHKTINRLIKFKHLLFALIIFGILLLSLHFFLKNSSFLDNLIINLIASCIFLFCSILIFDYILEKNKNIEFENNKQYIKGNIHGTIIGLSFMLVGYFLKVNLDNEEKKAMSDNDINITLEIPIQVLEKFLALDEKDINAKVLNIKNILNADANTRIDYLNQYQFFYSRLSDFISTYSFILDNELKSKLLKLKEGLACLYMLSISYNLSNPLDFKCIIGVINDLKECSIYIKDNFNSI